MKPEKIIPLILIVLWLLSTLLLSSGAAFPANSVESVVSPYFFNLPKWEVVNIWGVLRSRLPWLGKDNRFEQQSDEELVREYFRLGQEIRTLYAQLERLSASGNTGTHLTNQIQLQIQSISHEKKVREDRVKSIITRQIGKEMSSEGILPLPPIVFAFDTPPQILVISPRERIDLKKTILLEPGLGLGQDSNVSKLEAALEKQIEDIPAPPGQTWGISALVEVLGGLALYPSLVTETSTLEQAIPTIAHEWVHHYLFFRPLGRKYGTSYEMTTINETVANIVGDEIGESVLKEYGISKEKEIEKKRSGFDFDEEMKQIRIKVDDLLAQGKVLDAERYMEEQRQFLVEKGYYLRRLNQAYFAFHGSYADTPASTSPVAGWLRSIRNNSASTGDFLRKVAQISNYEELRAMASQSSSREH